MGLTEGIRTTQVRHPRQRTAAKFAELFTSGWFRRERCVSVRNVLHVRILRSARKHGITDADIRAVLERVPTAYELSDSPRKLLYRGFDQHARPLEIITVMADDGEEVVIHAMKLRKPYLSRLE